MLRLFILLFISVPLYGQHEPNPLGYADMLFGEKLPEGTKPVKTVSKYVLPGDSGRYQKEFMIFYNQDGEKLKTIYFLDKEGKQQKVFERIKVNKNHFIEKEYYVVSADFLKNNPPDDGVETKSIETIFENDGGRTQIEYLKYWYDQLPKNTKIKYNAKEQVLFFEESGHDTPFYREENTYDSKDRLAKSVVTKTKVSYTKKYEYLGDTTKVITSVNDKISSTLYYRKRKESSENMVIALINEQGDTTNKDIELYTGSRLLCFKKFNLLEGKLEVHYGDIYQYQYDKQYAITDFYHVELFDTVLYRHIERDTITGATYIAEFRMGAEDIYCRFQYKTYLENLLRTTTYNSFWISTKDSMAYYIANRNKLVVLRENCIDTISGKEQYVVSHLDYGKTYGKVLSCDTFRYDTNNRLIEKIKSVYTIKNNKQDSLLSRHRIGINYPDTGKSYNSISTGFASFQNSTATVVYKGNKLLSRDSVSEGKTYSERFMYDNKDRLIAHEVMEKKDSIISVHYMTEFEYAWGNYVSSYCHYHFNTDEIKEVTNCLKYIFQDQLPVEVRSEMKGRKSKTGTRFEYEYY